MKARVGLTMLGALMLTAVPFASHAGPNKALDACVSSFIDTYIPKDRTVRVRKYHPPRSSLAAQYSNKSTYTIALSARGTRSGKELAQARCVASNRGDVIVLDSPAPDTYVASADFAIDVTR